MNGTEEQKELEDVRFSDDTKLTKEMTGIGFDKKLLLDKEEVVEVVGLGMNRFGKHQLICNLEDEEIQLGISKKNKNQIIDLLGDSLSDWVGKEVRVKGILWEGDIEGEARTGVELVFSL